LNLAGNSRGFTLIEVLIFLGVSGALFISSIVVISGQQSNTDFRLAITDVNSYLQDISNDVSTGFYSNSGNITCVAPGNFPPAITFGGSVEQGTNSHCTFIGRALQFDGFPPSPPIEQFWVYNVVGRRQFPIGIVPYEVSNFQQAMPTAVAPRSGGGGITSEEAIQKINLNSGIKLITMKSVVGALETPASGVIFMSKLASYQADKLKGGTPTIDIIPIDSVGSSQEFAEKIYNLKDNPTAANANPSGGLKLCFENSASSKHAFVIFGANNALAPQTEFVSGGCPP